jgi:hypothetical protein
MGSLTGPEQPNQHQNRKPRDIAAEVAESGALPPRAGASPADQVRPR